jgi:hypothetical protein
MRTLLSAALLAVLLAALAAPPAEARITLVACAGACYAFFPPDPCDGLPLVGIPPPCRLLPPGPCAGEFVEGAEGTFGARVCRGLVG